MPLSRKKGFSKKALAAATAQQGFEYLHWQTPGCPRPIRDQYRADGNWRDYVERFSRYVETQDEVIADLILLANQRRCCLLCFEADAFYCHRSLVAQRARDNGGLFDIVHFTAASVDRQPVLA